MTDLRMLWDSLAPSGAGPVPDDEEPEPTYCGACGVSHDPTCDEAANLATFRLDGHVYTLALLDERPDVPDDPVLCLYRDDSAAPFASLHFDPLGPAVEE
jgi:hypothetical protein